MPYDDDGFEGRCVRLGEAGRALIQSYEKCVLSAYLPTPDDKWTVGWGHTGADVYEGLEWTQEQADLAFTLDVQWVENCVNKAVRIPLSQSEFDACASLCFNIGCSAFSGSTLVKLLNNGDYEGARAEFGRWNRQAGKVLAGLTDRREKEAQLFETA